MTHSVEHVGSGKVRELYEVGDDKLLLVASDRISAFDVVMERPIPDKGKVLTGLSHHWMRALADVAPNHMVSVRASDLPDVGIDDLPGRAMLCRRAKPLPVEFTVRGYLAGSGYKDYLATGSVCGHRLPEGLRNSEQLPKAILTPATKATEGHDENITEAEAAQIAGPRAYATAREYALALYERGAALALERGIIIADTKFEFGLTDEGVTLIDEVLTPDSSRFWSLGTYRPGRPQESWDKQPLRDWLDDSGWDHSPPAPELPDEIVAATQQRYLRSYELVTGKPLSAWLEEVNR